jgi:hypothetical protein
MNKNVERSFEYVGWNIMREASLSRGAETIHDRSIHFFRIIVVQAGVTQ